jgi:uncharacterized cupin superfamily protein
VGITHWDDVEKIHRDRGQMSATLTPLGTAAGSWRAGATRIELAPGEQPTPPHIHGDAEEIFYVLDGSGLTLLDDDAYEIRAGDCIVYKSSHEAHTIRAGDDGLDVIAFGAREYLPTSELPRGGTMWSITGFIELQQGHPWDREPELFWPDPLPLRPQMIVNTEDIEPQIRGGRRRRDLATPAGSRWTGLKHIELDPGVLSGPPHVHSAEEEIFVVLAGDGALELTPAGKDAEPEAHAVRTGSVVARPPGTKVAHAFRAGESGLTLIAWGTRDPNDICWYPRSKKILWRGVGVVGRVEPLDYWEGEELE